MRERKREGERGWVRERGERGGDRQNKKREGEGKGRRKEKLKCDNKNYRYFRNSSTLPSGVAYALPSDARTVCSSCWGALAQLFAAITICSKLKKATRKRRIQWKENRLFITGWEKTSPFFQLMRDSKVSAEGSKIGLYLILLAFPKICVHKGRQKK